MKNIKIVMLALILAAFSLSTFSCKKKCKDENPNARIINNGTQKASVQIKTSGGNTVNINNVDPSTSSPYSNYAPGEVVFTITVSNVNYVDTVPMINCYNYDISIDQNNLITVKVIDRND